MVAGGIFRLRMLTLSWRCLDVVLMFQTWCPGCCAAVSPPTTPRPTWRPRRLTRGRGTGWWPARRWSTSASWASVTRTAVTASATTSGTIWSTCEDSELTHRKCPRLATAQLFSQRSVIVITHSTSHAPYTAHLPTSLAVLISFSLVSISFPQRQYNWKIFGKK